MSAFVYPVSFAMLHLPFAAFWEAYLSSRSPPDHLLYQILKMVPVWGGGSDLMSSGSICGRAGRFFFLMIFFTFLAAGSATSLLVAASASSSWFSSGASAIFVCSGGKRRGSVVDGWEIIGSLPGASM